MNVLVVDVGGNNVKLHMPGREKRKFKSGRDLSPDQMVRQTLDETRDWKFDVVALGVPCRVVQGRPANEPYNLGAGWVDFDYAAAFARPVRIMNDANLQALGSYRGGRMLFLSSGTSVGSCLIADRVLISLELGQIESGEWGELAHTLNDDGLERLGSKRWQQAAHEILPRLKGALLVDSVVLGGGNAKKLDELPEGVRRGDNRDVLEGGLRLWQELPDPADPQGSDWRIL